MAALSVLAGHFRSGSPRHAKIREEYERLFPEGETAIRD